VTQVDSDDWVDYGAGVTVERMLICTGNERKACVSASSGDSMESNERHSGMDDLRVSDANTQHPVLVVSSCRCTKELEVELTYRGTILSEHITVQ
jgi:hypothetical protein